MRKLIPILLIIPNITFAEEGIIPRIDSASDIVSGVLIPLAFSLALLYFFWGVTKYIRKGAGDEKAAEEGKKIMIWGIVGLFVALSIWGIITFIQSELGIPEVDNPSVGNTPYVDSTFTPLSQ